MKSALVIQSRRGEAFIARNQGVIVTMIVRDQQSAAFIAKGLRVEISKPASACVHISREKGAAVILAGQRGPQGIGIPGPAGGSAVQRLAGETLSALRAVYELNGEVFTLDYRDALHISLMLGIALTAGSSGQLINIQRSGAIDDFGWSWSPGPVWLGVDGALTQVSPVDGYDLLIGSATAATRITLNLQDPIALEQ